MLNIVSNKYKIQSENIGYRITDRKTGSTKYTREKFNAAHLAAINETQFDRELQAAFNRAE